MTGILKHHGLCSETSRESRKERQRIVPWPGRPLYDGPRWRNLKLVNMLQSDDGECVYATFLQLRRSQQPAPGCIDLLSLT